MRRYSLKKTLKNLREIVFSNYMAYACFNNAYSNFIFRFAEAMNYIAPAKKVRRKANLKYWFDNQIMSAIKGRDKLYKKFKHSGLETDQDNFEDTEMHLQKMIPEEKKSYFEEELAKNRNKPKELWKALKSLGLSSDKARKSKISLKKDGKIQFETLENTNIFKRFYSVLAGDLQEKLPKAPNKFTSQTTKNYCAKTSCNVSNDVYFDFVKDI